MEETAEQAILKKLERKDTSSEMSCPGCGISLAIRLVIESLENFTMVGASGCSGLLSKNMNLKVPFIYADSNPVAVARGIENSVVIAGDGSTAENLQSIIYAAQNDENMIYICLNNHGYSNANEHSEKHFAEIIANHARYVATASLAKPEDLIKKIQKASHSKGFKFIEILCPCPIFWGFESSDTILISRLAVETGIWPLYEVEHSSLTLTEIPREFESISRFIAIQNKFKNFDEARLAKIHSDTAKRWKKLKKN